MSKLKIAILVPTRGRPHNLERLANALKKTCALEYKLLARTDIDDTSIYPPLDKVEYFCGPRIFFSKSVNELANKAMAQGFTHIAIFGDDVVPETKGWDEIMANSVIDLGIAYGSDGLEHLHTPDLPTHVVVPIEMYKKLGWIALPSLRHLYVDNVWRELGKLTQFIYFPDVKLTHMHRWNNMAPDDLTYQQANDKRKAHIDKRIFQHWLSSGGIKKAKRLLLQ